MRQMIKSVINKIRSLKAPPRPVSIIELPTPDFTAAPATEPEKPEIVYELPAIPVENRQAKNRKATKAGRKARKKQNRKKK